MTVPICRYQSHHLTRFLYGPHGVVGIESGSLPINGDVRTVDDKVDAGLPTQHSYLLYMLTHQIGAAHSLDCRRRGAGQLFVHCTGAR